MTDQPGKKKPRDNHEMDAFATSTIQWMDDTIKTYVKVLESATNHTAEALPGIVNAQSQIAKDFAEAVKESKNKEGLNIFQQEVMRTFLWAGLEFYRESRAQRVRMQKFEEDLLKKLTASIQKLTNQTKGQ
jgi:hypothetical protein